MVVDYYSYSHNGIPPYLIFILFVYLGIYIYLSGARRASGGPGKALFKEICERDLEGIVCKRNCSVYSKNRHAWLKVKNRDYTQAKDRQELFNPSS